jgi:hypothetical protein
MRHSVPYRTLAGCCDTLWFVCVTAVETRRLKCKPIELWKVQQPMSPIKSYTAIPSAPHPHTHTYTPSIQKHTYDISSKSPPHGQQRGNDLSDHNLQRYVCAMCVYVGVHTGIDKCECNDTLPTARCPVRYCRRQILALFSACCHDQCTSTDPSPSCHLR